MNQRIGSNKGHEFRNGNSGMQMTDENRVIHRRSVRVRTEGSIGREMN
jgi:hypothetical protein